MNKKLNNEVVIIMTYYKCQQYFKEQINSIKRQTKLPNKLLIVNDSADKNETKFLHTFNFGKLRVEIIDNKKNYGCTKSIYIGLKRAYALRAQYIWFSDDDDIWLPNKIELQYKALKNGAEVCNHYSQKLIYGKLLTINFANCAGHSLSFNANSFKQGINLISKTKFNNLNATYDTIFSLLCFMNKVKWETINEVLVYHRLYNNEHFTINNEMHKSLKQDIINLYNGIYAYKNMKDYLDQNTDFKTTPKKLFDYYRNVVNKYELCDFSTKLKNYIFNLLGYIILHK